MLLNRRNHAGRALDMDRAYRLVQQSARQVHDTGMRASSALRGDDHVMVKGARRTLYKPQILTKPRNIRLIVEVVEVQLAQPGAEGFHPFSFDAQRQYQWPVIRTAISDCQAWPGAVSLADESRHLVGLSPVMVLNRDAKRVDHVRLTSDRRQIGQRQPERDQPQ